MTGALVDTGFLIALFRRGDKLRSAARAYLREHAHALATVTPIIGETCVFLDTRAKADLLEWTIRGGLSVVDIPADGFVAIRTTFLKYADRDLDFADAALVWLAMTSGCRRILTVDARDFQALRVKGNKPFEIVSWMD
ncbi:MAG TPA: PIN domain-containing protein [Burkholderiales bacterium]|nr:PIN domain-containing protein [Burkholderiales bacterium]